MSIYRFLIFSFVFIFISCTSGYQQSEDKQDSSSEESEEIESSNKATENSQQPQSKINTENDDANTDQKHPDNTLDSDPVVSSPESLDQPNVEEDLVKKDSHQIDPQSSVEDSSQDPQHNIESSHTATDDNISNQPITVADGLDSISKDQCQTLTTGLSYLLFNHRSYGIAADYLNDDFSEKVFDNYLMVLDPYKIYLTLSEYKSIKDKYATTLDDSLRISDCSPFFEILSYFLDKYSSVKYIILHLAEIISQSGIMPRTQYYQNIDSYTVEYASDLTQIKKRINILLNKKIVQYFYTVSQSEFDKLIEYVLYGLFDIDQDNIYNLNSEDFPSFLMSVLLSSFDRYSDFFSKEEAQKFSERLYQTSEVYGIGIHIDAILGKLVISEISVGGGAYKEGSIDYGDHIVGVKQDNPDAQWVISSFHNSNEIIDLIRGPEGTMVHLRMSRPNQDNPQAQPYVYEVMIQRGKLDLSLQDKPVYRMFSFSDDQVTHYHPTGEPSDLKTSEDLDQSQEDFVGQDHKPSSVNIGYIYLSNFYGRNYTEGGTSGVAEDFLYRLKKIDQSGADLVLIDLRDNSGGDYNQVNSMVSALLNGVFSGYSNDINTFQLLNRVFARAMIVTNHHSSIDYELDYSFPNIPVVVLINRESASASEALVQSIKASGRGIVIGDDRSYGKGTIQNLKSFPIFSNMDSITIGSGIFYGIDGKSVSQVGVSSDIVIPSVEIHNSLPAIHDDDFQQYTIKIEDDEIYDFGMRPQSILQTLGSQYTQRFLDSDPTYRSSSAPSVFRIYQWLQYSTIYNNLQSLLKVSSFSEAPWNSDMFSIDNIDQEIFTSQFVDGLEQSYREISQENLEAIRAKIKVNYYDDDLDKKFQLWQQIYDNDYILQEALSISLRYFQLCSGVGTDKYQLEFESGCVNN